jgi:hypothetical protein
MKPKWKVIDVCDMNGERVRFTHVAKHLYNPKECWDKVCNTSLCLYDCACQAECTPAELKAAHPDCYRVSGQCRAHVLQDHDKLLAPAYRKALCDAERSGRMGLQGDGAWCFVGDSGVTVIVREVTFGNRRRPEVKTAYRALPPGDGQENEDFFKAAVRKLRDKTSWDGGGQ